MSNFLQFPKHVHSYFSNGLQCRIIIIFLLVCIASFAQAQEYSTWKGTKSSDWSDHDNWNFGWVPTDVTEAVIPSSPHSPIITSSVKVRRMSVESGATLRIESTGTLTIGAGATRALHIDGTLNNSGTLLITSGSDGLFNNGTITNALGATLTITCKGDGIYNAGISIVNQGTIGVVSTGTGNTGAILSRSPFTNSTTGVITINDAPEIGINLSDDVFTNQGTIEIGTTSTISSLKGIYASKGTMSNSGRITVANSRAAYVQGGAEGKLTNQGTFTGGIVGGAVEYIINQETPTTGFTNEAGGLIKGNGKIDSFVLNSQGGTLSPGNSPGIISFVRSVELDNTTMAMEVNGKTTAGTDFDQITFNNQVKLGGPLQLTINYPSPADDDEVVLINATAIEGTFSSVTGLAAGWELKYNVPTTGKVSIRYSSALPVQLTYFEATLIENQAQLKWQTASEENAESVEIERSMDGKRWNKIGTVRSVGTATTPHDYTYVDRTPQLGTNFYRLRLVDHDGQSDYSLIRSVVADTQLLHTYPNPTHGLVYFKGNHGLLKVYNSLGKQVAAATADAQQLDLSHVPAGIYFIRSSSDANAPVIRVMKR